MLEFRKDIFADERDDNLIEVGQPTARQDILGHVTGTSPYYDDHRFANLLHLKILRSPHAHARIRSIDDSAAARAPGVKRIIRAADVPVNLNTLLSLIQFGKDDEPSLASDVVRYKGEPILGIVATSERAALEALALVRVSYDQLPAVFDVEEALKPGAPSVNATYPKNTFEYYGKYDHQKLRFGDVEAGFKQADIVLEDRYQMSPIEHAPTETNGSITVPDTNGRYIVYTSTQALFFSLDTSAKINAMQSNQLHFIGGTVGGGFGGKVDTLTEPLCILAARLTGAPVRYRFSRHEEMQFGSPRGAERIYVKDGLTKDGRIVARSVRAYFDSGAYTRLSSYAVVKCVAHIPGPYTIPNVYADVYCVFTNRTPATAMRGFGVTALDFALECHMDKGAVAVGMDPLEFRMLNMYRDGDMKAHRREAKNCALIECAQVAAEKASWPLRDEFRRMSSRQGGSHERAGVADRSRTPQLASATKSPAPGRADLRPVPQRVAYERPAPAAPARTAPPPPPPHSAAATAADRRPHRRPARPTVLRASHPSSAPGGADHGQASRARRRHHQLSDRHESRRRSEPGAGSFQSDRQIHRRAVVDRPRPGNEIGHAADLRGDVGRAGRGRLCRYRQFRHRAALHGLVCLARHASCRQRGDDGGARGARGHAGGRGRGTRSRSRRSGNRRQGFDPGEGRAASLDLGARRRYRRAIPPGQDDLGPRHFPRSAVRRRSGNRRDVAGDLLRACLPDRRSRSRRRNRRSRPC